MLVIIILVLASNLFAQMPNTLSDSDKIYGLSKFWQEVNYNFIYLNKIDRKMWDKEYQKLIIDVQNTNNDYEYYLLLQKFCALLNDGHTGINFPETVLDNIYVTDFGEYRLFLTNIEDKAIITRVNYSKRNEIPIGSEIIKVNGISTSVYLEEKVIPYTSASTDYLRQGWAVKNMFLGQEGAAFEIEIKYVWDIFIKQDRKH